MLKTNLSILFFSFCLNFLFISIFFSKANILRLNDFTDNRKLNSDSVPIVAGLAMFITFIFFSIYLYNDFSILYLSKIKLLLLSTAFIFVIGIIDDSITVSTIKKICFQLALSIFFIYSFELYKISIGPFFNNYYFNFIVQIIFILGITNSINLIDGIDNLAGSLSIIISISFIIIANFLEYNAAIFYIIIGSLFSYLIYNNFVRRVFLGDSGSFFLGWIFSIISLLFMKYSSNFTVHIPLLILAIPAFDVIYVMINRFMSATDSQILKRFNNIFFPDHSHVHHSFLTAGFNNKNICFILCSLSILFSLISFLTFIYIDNYWFRTIVLIFMMLVFSLIRFKIGKCI